MELLPSQVVGLYDIIVVHSPVVVDYCPHHEKQTNKSINTWCILVGNHSGDAEGKISGSAEIVSHRCIGGCRQSVELTSG